jgi:glycerol-3-phosphate acyltransferase PlsY
MEQLRSADWANAAWVALAAYSLGCFATGYYLVRCRTGQDLRDLGSGNLGARNVGRVLGWRGFVLTLLGDFGKGALAVWAAQHFSADSSIIALAMIAVVVGHIWPVQLRFQGGKGAATSVGALWVYDFHLALAFLLLFGGATVLLRKTIASGLLAYLCLPVACYWLVREGGKAVEMTTFISILSGLVLLAHRKNITAEALRFWERRQLRTKSNRS